MRFRCLYVLAATFGVLTLGDPLAYAQGGSPSEIVLRYRAYTSAMERGDFKTAETEAAAALTAAEASGDRKASVLAFNLARLRAFELGDLETARAPAQLAMERGGGGVRPEHARLILLLTDLKVLPREAQAALNTAMISAKSSPDADVDFHYRVARAWGLAALRDSREASAEQAFAHAVDLARRMSGDNALDLAFALVELGATLVVRGEDSAGYQRLLEAAELLVPRLTETPGTSVSPSFLLYAETYAWMMVVRSKNTARRYAPIPRRDMDSREPRVCNYELRSLPRPIFPRPAIARLSVGAVILRLGADATGALTHVQVVGAVPRADFSAAVLAVTPDWRVIWKETGDQCRRETDNIIVPINFRYD